MNRYRIRKVGELRAIAESENCELIIAADNELLLDVDFTANFTAWSAMFAGAMNVANEKYGAVVKSFWKSRSKGLHILIQLNRALESEEALVLQAALGSDSVREIIALWEGQNAPHGCVRSLFKPLEQEDPEPLEVVREVSFVPHPESRIEAFKAMIEDIRSHGTAVTWFEEVDPEPDRGLPGRFVWRGKEVTP